MKGPESEPIPDKTVRIAFFRYMNIDEMSDRLKELKKTLATQENGQGIEKDLLPFFTERKIAPKCIVEEQAIKRGLFRKEEIVAIEHKIKDWSLEEDEKNLRLKLKMQSGEELIVRRPRMNVLTVTWFRDLLTQDWVLETKIEKDQSVE